MKKIGAIMMAVCLCSCFERDPGAPLAPIASGRATEKSTYIVKKGDTLFSIAWKFDKDYKALAYYNHLDEFQTLKPGMSLSLISPRAKAKAQSSKSSKSKKYLSLKKTASNPRHLSVKAKRQTTIAPLQRHWYWPAKGRLVQTFNPAKQQKGINISGMAGSPVLATQGGVVAYSGNGLSGYGNLVILRHAKGFLSAYAFNQRILVKEGQKVKANQKIAEMGRRKGAKGSLHFEIRYRGRPVNPLKYVSQKSA